MTESAYNASFCNPCDEIRNFLLFAFDDVEQKHAMTTSSMFKIMDSKRTNRVSTNVSPSTYSLSLTLTSSRSYYRSTNRMRVVDQPIVRVHCTKPRCVVPPRRSLRDSSRRVWRTSVSTRVGPRSGLVRRVLHQPKA